MPDNPTLDGLPEDVQKYIRELRSEAASYRTERNDYRNKFTEVSTKYAESGTLLEQANAKLDKFATVESVAEDNAKRAAELEQKYAKATIAWDAGLSKDDVDRIKGDKPEEWQSDAAELAKRIGKTPRTLPKDDAARAATPSAGKENPILKAFEDAGFSFGSSE